MSAETPLVLVANPWAAAGRAESRIPAVEGALRAAGATFSTRRTEGPRDATRIVREALQQGARGIVVVGGDGTFSEAVNGFFDDRGKPVETDAWLGPVPCGTGGDFSRTLALPGDVGDAATRMLAAEPRAVDCGWLTYLDHQGAPAGRAFLNIASFGLGGLVDQLANSGPKWIGGKSAFLLATVRAALRYAPARISLQVDDGEAVETIISNVAVCNGRYFGGGMHIAPGALIDDGLLDVVTVEARPLLPLIGLMRHLYDGTILEQSGIHHRRGARIVAEAVDGGTEVLLDVDGEAPGRLPATFEVRRAALRLRA